MSKPDACHHCAGTGKVKEPCATCGGRGWVVLDQGGHNCRCSNLRCVKCGGEGRIAAAEVLRAERRNRK